MMLWLAAVAVAWCQGTMAFESGVATFESGPAWVAGPSEGCRPYTVLSPDGAERGKARVRPEKEKAKPATERVLLPSAGSRECRAAYRMKTVDMVFASEAKGLSKEQEGQLASLVMEQPDGVVVVRYVERSGERHNTERGAAQVAAVRSYLEGLLVTRPSFTEEQRVGTDRTPQHMTVTAIYRNGCRDQESLRADVARGGHVERLKEGSAVKK